jgi:hypothetical protein
MGTPYRQTLISWLDNLNHHRTWEVIINRGQNRTSRKSEVSRPKLMNRLKVAWGSTGSGARKLSFAIPAR